MAARLQSAEAAERHLHAIRHGLRRRPHPARARCPAPVSWRQAHRLPAPSPLANGNGTVEFDELVTAILPDMNEEILINQEQLMEVFQSFERKRMRE
ncbi:putative calcium-binding protein CML15 [Prunus yedoensis var. nudiflora]|uniref:Putative calcium-binding protein CML15 n=1 Tax=Prunus yedoensis var. nudiflora TaxID=2094558 RepID=A0A314USK7_PRUYE|nr:putative calcium-binding protein CML15 [Prunus yedoensis var. nudiflora]